MEHLSTPATPWLALTFSYALHTSHFEMLKGLSCGSDMLTRFLPEHRPVDRVKQIDR
jgi:hypothetical protein